MPKINTTSPEAIESWNHCMHIIIAYHMARVYKEHIGPAVKRACMGVSLKTKDQVIYAYCMRIIHSPDAASIERSVLALQQNFEGLGLV